MQFQYLSSAFFAIGMGGAAENDKTGLTQASDLFPKVPRGCAAPKFKYFPQASATCLGVALAKTEASERSETRRRETSNLKHQTFSALAITAFCCIIPAHADHQETHQGALRPHAVL